MSCAAGVCLSPWVDFDCLNPSMQRNAEVDPILKPWMLKFFSSLYLNKANSHQPLASALFSDLSGLPPLLIQVDSSEILLDDGIQLANRAQLANVEVKLTVWNSMIHLWHFFSPMLSEAKDAMIEIDQFISTYI